MKVSYRTRDDRYQIEAEGDITKDVFRGIAALAEVLEASGPCGNCNGVDTILRVRKIEENEFFEAYCLSCHAALAYGQHRQGGGLFPKKTWQVYERTEQE